MKSAVIPVVTAFEAALNRGLLLPSERDDMYFAFDTSELLKGDILKRYQAYKTGLENNVLQIDEVRYKEDLPPLGINFIKLGLQDVLYDPKTKTIYTPNMNQSMTMSENKVNFGNDEVDNAGQDGIMEEREAVFGEGHKIVDNTPEGGDISSAKSDSENDSGLAKNLQLDDVLSVTSGGSIRDEVAKEIYDTIVSTDNKYKFDKVVVSRIDPKIVMQTDAVQSGTFFDTTLVLNENFLGGKSLEQIDAEIKNSRKTVANSLQEAVVHETYHAKLISGLNMGQLEGLYDELSDYHIQGVSPTAFIDGSECIAEVGILLSRGEGTSVPRQAMDLFDQYMEGK